MNEIALRAGATTTYSWGDTFDDAYVVYTGTTSNNNSQKLSTAVGSRLCNNWGLYDMTGLVYEWMLDDGNQSNYKITTTNPADPFTPYAHSSTATQRRIKGGDVRMGSDYRAFKASDRGNNFDANQTANIGFRVSLIED